jgi:hypothetical protein
MRRASRARGLALAALAVALAQVARADAPPAPAAVDPAAKLPTGGSASEYWDLVALLDDGFRVTARFVITNEGPGERSAAAFGHVLRLGAEPVVFQNARREGKWRLAPDGRRIEIGSSHLDFSGVAPHFEVDNDKRAVKVFLDWSADASSRKVPAAALPPGYAVDVLAIASPVRASIQVGGMAAPRKLEGRLTLSHTWMQVPESELVLRRIDVTSAGDAPGAFVLDVLSPAGKRFGWLLVADGKAMRSPAQLDTRIESSRQPGSYPIPSALVLDGGDLRGRVNFGPPWLEVDPLAALPSVLRMVYSLRGRPHRSWAEAGFEFAWVPEPEHPMVQVAGDAIASLSFLDALPPSPKSP